MTATMPAAPRSGRLFFDVLVGAGDPDEVTSYEAYVDEAVVDAHMAARTRRAPFAVSVA